MNTQGFYYHTAIGIAAILLIGCATTVQEIPRQQIGDNRLSCKEIEDQVYTMEHIMQEAGIDMRKEETFIHVTEASRQVGATAAAKADHTVILYTSSTASLLKNMSTQNRAKLQRQGQKARDKRAYLMGLYDQKHCK